VLSKRWVSNDITWAGIIGRYSRWTATLSPPYEYVPGKSAWGKLCDMSCICICICIYHSPYSYVCKAAKCHYVSRQSWPILRCSVADVVLSNTRYEIISPKTSNAPLSVCISALMKCNCTRSSQLGMQLKAFLGSQGSTGYELKLYFLSRALESLR